MPHAHAHMCVHAYVMRFIICEHAVHIHCARHMVLSHAHMRAHSDLRMYECEREGFLFLCIMHHASD
jgi:hypothetical protein